MGGNVTGGQRWAGMPGTMHAACRRATPRAQQSSGPAARSPPPQFGREPGSGLSLPQASARRARTPAPPRPVPSRRSPPRGRPDRRVPAAASLARGPRGPAQPPARPGPRAPRPAPRAHSPRPPAAARLASRLSRAGSAGRPPAPPRPL
jgi:hypothetical protein